MSSRLAAIQMVSTRTVRKNLQAAQQLITKAVNEAAELVVLPENFALMGQTEKDKLDCAEVEGDGPIQGFLSTQARESSVWVVGGTVPLKTRSESKIAVACLVYNDKGQQVARYDKIHLFDVTVPGSSESYQESDTIEKGALPVVLDSPVGRLGLAICYDIRFPELFRKMLDSGLDVIALPAAFTAKTGKAHWEILLRARAIENQCYLVAANQGGRHANGRRTYGDSMIVDPWGVVLTRKKEEPGIVVADFDPAELARIRESFPALRHRCLSRQGLQ